MGDVRVLVPFRDYEFLTFHERRWVSSCPPGARTAPIGGTLLTYAPTIAPTNLTFQGGAIAPGVPVELLFWGDWWNAAGAGERDALISAVQTLLAGPYTRALDQYGISQPTYRGFRVVPGKPTTFGWSDIQGFVQGLIDSGAYPEPDEDGGRNGYFVMMPTGSTDTTSAQPCGAHGQYVETDFLGLDPDHAWIAYINYGSLDTMTSCFSHELAELLTDPEQNAWYVQGVPGSSSEIGDLCDIRQNWVDSVKVRSYWSNRDQMCVIPTDAAYSVCIAGSIDEDDRKLVKEGKAHPKTPEGGIGVLLPACNFEGLEFPYKIYQDVESASLTATATGYHAPVFAWTVAGQLLAPAAGNVTVTADVTYADPGGNVRFSTDPIVLQYTINGSSLRLTNDAGQGSFDVLVAVVADEDPAQSDQATNGARRSGIVVSFIGRSIDEPDYQAAVERCSKAAHDLWVKTHPQHVPVPGPVNPGPLHEQDLTLFHELPGWVTSQQREQVRVAIVEAAHLRADEPDAADSLRTILLNGIGLPAQD
jgi:hypothetical protein